MLDSLKQYIKGRAREATLYTCLATTALGSGGCAALKNFGRDYVDFHKNPPKFIKEKGIGSAVLPLVVDGLIVYGISEALDKDGDGGGGATRPSPTGPPF